MQKPFLFFGKQFLPVLTMIVCFFLFSIFQSCQKSGDIAGNNEVATKKKNPPPPPPFTYNCGAQVMSGNFVVGVPTNVTVTFTYLNSPGGSHNGYTSVPVDGITFTTPPGTLNVGSGSITYTASGTPTSSGQFLAIVGLTGYNNVGCGFAINVLNPPSNCNTTIDPGPTVGSTGCVVFTYRGQQVSYSTVRAADGKIWLQQNLGSPQVANSGYDQASFGHYFQWGRWDDGHQLPNSPTIPYSSSLDNPSHIPNGNPNFISSSSWTVGWWSTGTLTDIWSGTLVSATNGKDPCAALGAGWRMPTRADWDGVLFAEDITSQISAYMSRLKLPSSGQRQYYSGTGHYWSGTATDNGGAYELFFDENYQAPVQATVRQVGNTCRCVKD